MKIMIVKSYLFVNKETIHDKDYSTIIFALKANKITSCRFVPSIIHILDKERI